MTSGRGDGWADEAENFQDEVGEELLPGGEEPDGGPTTAPSPLVTEEPGPEASG